MPEGATVFIAPAIPVVWLYSCPVLGCRNLIRPSSLARTVCAEHVNGYELTKLIWSDAFVLSAMFRKFAAAPKGVA